MSCKKSISLGNPAMEQPQVTILEYENSFVVWIGSSPEIYTPQPNGRAVSDIVNSFCSNLQKRGFEILRETI